MRVFIFCLFLFIISQAQKTNLREENLKLQETNRALKQALNRLTSLRSLNMENEAKVGENEAKGNAETDEVAVGNYYYS